MSSKPHLTEVTQIPNEPSSKPERRSLWELAGELRKRKVCRTAISYMLVMWLNLQIGDVIFPMIGLPDWSLSLIIIIGVMGFPVVLIIAWVFQVTPEGIVIDSEEKTEANTDRHLDTLVNLLLLLSSIVLSFLLLLQFATDQRSLLPELTAQEVPHSIVLSELSIEPASDDAVMLAQGIQKELRHLLINVDGIEVLPAASQIDPEDNRRRLALSGTLLLDGSTAHLLAHVIDLSAGRYLTSITFNLEIDSVLKTEITAAERIIEEVSEVLLPPNPETLAKIASEKA
jgi:TolB-like protein